MESLVVSVTVPSSEEDTLVGLFYESGSVGVEVQNFDSGQITLRVFFPTHLADSLPRVLNRITPLLSRSSRQSLATTILPHEDWQKRWCESLRSFPVGNTFFIVPDSHEVDAEEAGSRTRLRIEPGLAFGTGTHESTQLCLKVLEQIEVKGKTILDVGTGAGILSIACIKCGARAALACDIDPTAVKVAMENFSLNQTSAGTRIWIGSLDALRTQSVEICFANLTAGIFESLWPEFERVLLPRGRLVCSGILKEQSESVESQLRQHRFLIEQLETANEWVGILARREANP